jgi:hypothetical protein
MRIARKGIWAKGAPTFDFINLVAFQVAVLTRELNIFPSSLIPYHNYPHPISKLVL